MKTNKDEDLQSRREFFKNAAKAALPIVGAIVLAHVPIDAHATQVSSCTGTCHGMCHGGCKGCQYTCSGTCSNSCRGTCMYSSK